MKAYELEQFGVGNLHLVEREMPRPTSDAVLVKFHAASLNFRDVMVVAGNYNPRMRLPAVPFSDGAGEIVEEGPTSEIFTSPREDYTKALIAAALPLTHGITRSANMRSGRTQ